MAKLSTPERKAAVARMSEKGQTPQSKKAHDNLPNIDPVDKQKLARMADRAK